MSAKIRSFRTNTHTHTRIPHSLSLSTWSPFWVFFFFEEIWCVNYYDMYMNLLYIDIHTHIFHVSHVENKCAWLPLRKVKNSYPHTNTHTHKLSVFRSLSLTNPLECVPNSFVCCVILSLSSFYALLIRILFISTISSYSAHWRPVRDRECEYRC